MARSTPVQAAQDERDIFETTSAASFASQFPAADKPTPAGLIPTVATGGSTPTTKTEEPGGASFSDWWGKDSTQEKFQGIMGSLGAIFGGMAGIPLGGGDMSSMERAAVRAQQAPGRARQMIREKQFTRYIDQELESATDPQRRDMLMAVRANPQAAAQYLAMESPGSKKARAESLAEAKHGYKMAEIALENEGRGVTANRADDIGTVNNLFNTLTPKEQSDFREHGRVPFHWFRNPGIINLIPHLYSPNGGVLGGNSTEFPFDLTGEFTFDDPSTGEEKTVGIEEFLQTQVFERWDSLTEWSRRWWDMVFKRHDAEKGAGSEESKSVRERSGLE